MARAHVELPLPERDAAIGIDAIRHRADTVRIGGPGFGVHDKAANSVTDIERLCRGAHGNHARLLVTLGAILRDDARQPARRLAWQRHAAGVDARIVQDMDLLQLDLPPSQLHASTQNGRTRTPARNSPRYPTPDCAVPGSTAAARTWRW